MSRSRKFVYTFSMRKYRRKNDRSLSVLMNIPEKANRILNLILVMMMLIVLRLWHLAVIQYEDKLNDSRKPQRKVIIEPAKRATIRDRFNIPLAINKVQYQVSILYSQFRQIPSVQWETDAQGKRFKHQKRREYIEQLAYAIAKELKMDPERLEDLIHSKGALYYHIPFLIKEDLTEQEYYRLKMLEKDWIGIHVQRVPKRYYPQGKVAADIIGYMGSINQQQYEAIIHEIKTLEQYLLDRENGEDPPLPENIATPQEARKRLKDLQEHAYTINDHVGKTGIERRFEEDLRGFHGKKSFYSDARGNYLRELPNSRLPLSGQRLLLTISAELQEFAEKLLVQNERIREDRLQMSGFDFPWIKGGAIVVLEPQTGDVLALASYPRFDPNDFIFSGLGKINKEKCCNIGRWFESESYLAEIWDQKRPLERERYDDKEGVFYEEQKLMDWENYLSFILPKDHSIKKTFDKLQFLKYAVILQRDIARLLVLSGQENLYWVLNVLYQDEDNQAYGGKVPSTIETMIRENLTIHSQEIAKIKNHLSYFFQYLPHNYDKVLLTDLCRLIVCENAFHEELLEKVGKHPISIYRQASAATVQLREVIQEMAKELFHDVYFKNWRKQNEKEFLKKIRMEEKARKQYPKPYIDYFDRLENEMFKDFWKQHSLKLLASFLMGNFAEIDEPELKPYLNFFVTWHDELERGAHQAVTWRESHKFLQTVISELSFPLAMDYLKTMRGFKELTRPLYGRYRSLRKSAEQQLEKHLAAGFYPVYGYGYGRSQAFRQATTQGSIFKLVTSYEALVQQYQKIDPSKINPINLNPLVMTDQIFRHGNELCVGYSADEKPIPQLYKGGRLLKSHAKNIGKLDLLKALETSSNPYFSLIAGDVLHSPQDLARAAKEFSFGTRTEIDLTGEIAGKIPNDLETNRTGLYALANGQHSLIVTPLQTSVMLAAVANGGNVLKPKIVRMTAGKKPKRDVNQLFASRFFPYEESLALVGIDFPLFTAIPQSHEKSDVKNTPTEIKRQLLMPDIIRKMLWEGMRRVISKQIKENLLNLSRFYRDYPEAISDFLDLKYQLIGKTSTAESKENLSLDLYRGTNLYNHVWFGGIVFESDIVNNDEETILYKGEMGNPELIVVVYLRYGMWGKETIPIAAQMVKKWREIKERHHVPIRQN